MTMPRRSTTFNPYRRAIAMAIDLERTYDSIAGILGHSMPLHDRITTEPGRRPGKEKLRLPRPLSLDLLNQMAATRMEAISELHARLAPTLGSGEIRLIDDLVEEMRERTGSEENHRGIRRGPSRQIDPEDRMTSGEILRRDIERAADAPPPPIVRTQEPLTSDDTPKDRISFSIDLMTEGLLDHHGIDRDALYDELLRHREKLTKANSSVLLTSPALRSNTAKPLRALGKAFPPAMFRLRGLSLDVDRITMPIRADQTDYGTWTYRGTSGGRDTEAPRLTREDGMHGYDLFDMPRRALRDVLQDIRFHDAIVIDQTDRFGAATANPTTVIRLRRGYAHLDPPGGMRGRLAVRRPSDVREYRQRFNEPHLVHAPMVDRILREMGQMQRHRLRPHASGGVTLSIAERNGDTLLHNYEIKPDTIADGEEAVRARIANIITVLADWTRKNSRTAPLRPAAPAEPGRIEPQQPPEAASAENAATATGDQIDGDTMSAASGQSDEAAKDDGTPSEPEVRLTPAETVAKHWGAEAAEGYERSERIDDLLLDVLRFGGLADPEDVELHQLEKLTCVKRMRIARDMLYRVEKFDRVMGRVTHAIGTVEVERHLSPGTIEALRDGNIGMLIKTWPNFARSQVRRVSQRDGMVLVTIRIPLSERE